MARLHYLYEQEGSGKERFIYYCSSCNCILRVRRDLGPTGETIDSLSGRCVGCGRGLESNIECRLAPVPDDWSDIHLTDTVAVQRKDLAVPFGFVVPALLPRLPTLGLAAEAFLSPAPDYAQRRRGICSGRAHGVQGPAPAGGRRPRFDRALHRRREPVRPVPLLLVREAARPQAGGRDEKGGSPAVSSRFTSSPTSSRSTWSGPQRTTRPSWSSSPTCSAPSTSRSWRRGRQGGSWAPSKTGSNG